MLMNGFEHSLLVKDPEIIEGYLKDASNIKGYCEGVFRPNTTDDVVEIVRVCNTHQWPLTISAQRTSTTGGPVPFGGVLMSMEGLNQIHSTTEVDAGVLLGQYQAFVEGKGFCFPPDPTSKNECSIGGAIACNASGARSFRYGPIRHWVEGLELVTPTGEILQIDRQSKIPQNWMGWNSDIWTPPLVKTAAGYQPCDNILDLMIGQEGTLGIITKAWLRNIPKPEVTAMLIFFSTLEDCLATAEELKKGAQRPFRSAEKNAVNPCAIEFFDQFSIRFMRNAVADISEKAECGLFLELDLSNSDMEHCIQILEKYDALLDCSILAEDPISKAKLHQARHAIPAGVNEIVSANGMPKVGTDFAVPDEYLVDMMEYYMEVPLDYVLFGHLGDNHLHLNMLPKNDDELALAKRLYRQLALKAVSFGGTVSAEHGIGKIKKDLLRDMVGQQTIEQFCHLKKVLDPNWVLGRETLFSPFLMDSL